MKTTKEQAIMAYDTLAGAKLGKMKDGDKFAAVKIMRALKSTASDYRDYLKDASDKLKPEGFDELQGRELTAEEQKVATKYQQDVSRCLSDELAKEIELDFTPLSEEGLKSLIDSNDFTLGQIMTLQDVIGHQ